MLKLLHILKSIVGSITINSKSIRANLEIVEKIQKYPGPEDGGYLCVSKDVESYLAFYIILLRDGGAKMVLLVP